MPAEPFDCVTLPPPASPFGWQILSPEFIWMEATFDPNSFKGLIFSQVDKSGFKDSIFYFDLFSHQKSFLLTGKANEPAWGSKNWVVFASSSLYKFKSDGTGFARMNISGISSRPIWSPNGEAFVFANFGNAPGLLHMIADIEGTMLDTIQAIRPFDWFESDSLLGTHLIPGTNQIDIFTSSIKTTQLAFFSEIPKGRDPRGDRPIRLKMFPHRKKIAILTANGLWIGSKGFSPFQIVQSCDNRRVYDIDLSPDGRYIFTQEVDYVQVDSSTVKKTIRLAKRDAYTGRLIETIFESK